jgi:hypothetical protein
LLEGTSSAPPRFATALPPQEVGEDTSPGLSPAPEVAEAEYDPDTSSLQLRAPLQAGVREQTLSRKAVPPADGEGGEDISTLDREWTFDETADESVDEPVNRATGEYPVDDERTLDDEYDRPDTYDDFDGDTMDRQPFLKVNFDDEEQPSEQDKTNIRHRRRRSLTSEEDELKQALPLQPKDTEEPFQAVNLAELEKQLDGADPAKMSFVSAKDLSEASKELTKPEKRRPKVKKAAPKLRSLAEEAERSRKPTGDLGTYAPPRKKGGGGGTVARRGLPWGSIAIGLILAVAICFVTWWGLTQWKARKKPSPVVPAAVADAATVPVAEAADAQVVVPLPTAACMEGMVLVSGQGESYDDFCVDIYEHPGKGEQPVVEISYADAKAICEERGARLCRPAEWVAACRGPNKATYPYGVAFAADKCNVDRNAIRDIVATGSFAECVSAAGIFDASGNVAEWVEGRYSYGGSAQDRTPGRCPERKAWPNPSHKQGDIGFRCCASPKKNRY